MTRPILIAALLAAGLALTAAGCGSDNGSSNGSSPGSPLPQGQEKVNLDPADFTTEIDNPYYPIRPGAIWRSEEVEEGETTTREVEVTDQIKVIDGIKTRVTNEHLRDDKGELIEETFDYYAQDKDGNVWYLGEDTTEYQNGKVKTKAGSFRAGVKGAQPGVVMPANPEQGMTYSNEYAPGGFETGAEDHSEVLEPDTQVEAAAGHFEPAVLIQSETPLEPKLLELTYYARGVGPVLALTVSGGASREDLISFKR